MRCELKVKMAILLVLVLSSSITIGLLFVLPTPLRAQSSAVTIEIEGYKEQVALIKWIGGIMVSGLSAALIFVVRQLLTQGVALVTEVKAGAAARAEDTKIRQESHQLLMDKIGELTKAIVDFQYRLPCINTNPKPPGGEAVQT